MAKDTIYLCNFRVSVDGEWLCLRELTDVQFDVPQLESPVEHDDRDPVVIERSNLLNVMKLVIKELIESSLRHGRMLDSEHVPLQHFFIVLEHVLRHGLKPKKGLLGPKKEVWGVVETVERFMPEAADITASVRDLPGIKTPFGRARAWLRLALMQKKLADYFRALLDRRENILSEFYEPYALLMEEEAVVIAGLLVGLNVIDCNLCVKEEDLDTQIGVIDFSLYLRDGNQIESPEEVQGSESSAKMTAVLDQKNYIEELNRHLNATVANLQAKVENLQTTNALMKEDLAIAKNQILSLQEQNDMMEKQQDSIEQDHQRKIMKSGANQSAKIDLDTERETYQTSRQGLDNLYSDTKKKLQDETNMRLEVEKELELQITRKTEMEMGFKMLEKEMHDKQDTIESLRRQLDDIKAINLEMYKKLQVCESSLKHKTELVAKLEQKTNQMSESIKQLEARIKQVDSERLAAEETFRSLGQQMADRDSKRSAVETDLKIEKEWRLSLQDSLIEEKEKLMQLQAEINQMKRAQKESQELRMQHEMLRATCEEQERALAELGSHLSESKLKMEDLKEVTRNQKEAAWASDKEATNCKGCGKPFSVARRKHHCRYCGEIFCHPCSDNTMPLPSSAKPVRVCDRCHTLLLERYSAT